MCVYKGVYKILGYITGYATYGSRNVSMIRPLRTRPSHKARTKAEIFFLPLVDFSLDEGQNMNKPHRYKVEEIYTGTVSINTTKHSIDDVQIALC